MVGFVFFFFFFEITLMALWCMKRLESGRPVGVNYSDVCESGRQTGEGLELRDL